MTTQLYVPRPSRNLPSSYYHSPERFEIRYRAHLYGSLFWAVVTGWCVRLAVVALVYKGFLDPGRGHWEFAYEMGRVARSIALGQGYANPYWAETGPTALLTPVYPYLLAGIFACFGLYTKASALVFLSLNSFFSAFTSVPIFLIARRNFDLRTANMAAWVWASFLMQSISQRQLCGTTPSWRCCLHCCFCWFSRWRPQTAFCGAQGSASFSASQH